MTEKTSDPAQLQWPDWVIHVEPYGTEAWVMRIDGDLLGAPVRGSISMASLSELHRLALTIDVYDAEALALRRRAAPGDAVAARAGAARDHGGGEAWREVPNPRWRTGNHVARHIYIHSGDADRGVYIGTVDSPVLAEQICEAMNERLAEPRSGDEL